MNNAKKLTAAVLAVAMAAVSSGCGDQTWSYKTEDVSLTTGAYIFNLLNAYYEARDLVESPDEVKDILKEEVKGSDSDAVTKTVEQYSLDTAEKTSKNMVAVEALFTKYGLTLDETEDEAARSYASQVWSTAKKTLEGYGIGEESFTYCYADYSVKNGQVFEHLYGENGDEYVKDDELKKYFTENYNGYAYFTVSMADTNDDGESVAKSDEEFKKTEEDLNKYAKELSDGKGYKSVAAEYIKEYELTYDPTYSGALEKEDPTTSIADEVVDAIGTLEEGKATVIKTGEDASTLFYLVYKPKYSDIEDYLSTESSTEDPTVSGDDVYIYNLKSGFTRYTLLNKMKGDDFSDYLKNYADSLNIQKNESAIKGYKVSKFISSDTDE